jgi:uncharacterized membrane protein YfcA
MFEILILLIAGIGAGIVTGLVGASAVMVVAPLLVVFLDYPTYTAIGLALSIDIFASLFATMIYKQNGRLKIKPTLILLLASSISVIIGSSFSKYIPSSNLGFATGIGIMMVGSSLLIKNHRKFSTTKTIPIIKKYKTLFLILVGVVIGLIAGVFGAGGGIMILFALIVILDYKTHEAIGTSVFIMIFVALFGGLTHYLHSSFSISSLALGSIGGIFGAIVASSMQIK